MNNLQLVSFVKAVYQRNWKYWYGTFGNKCTESLYEAKKKQYPAHYTASRASGYLRDIQGNNTCADCVGMIKAFFWMGGNIDSKPVYKSNHCPDTSANGMLELCAETGPIKTLPELPGLVVWKSGHIGVYIGNGYTIEMRGFDWDCVKRKVSEGPWTKWGRLPSSMLEYVDADTAEDNRIVRIEGGNCYIRSLPNTSGKILGVAMRGASFPYGGETAESGWPSIRYLGTTAWVSDLYGRVIP